MPKLGFKCFLGSFILSLAAVFVTTKAYLLLSISEQEQQETFAEVEAKSIELFATNEENDPIYEKLAQIQSAEAPLADEDDMNIKLAESDVIAGTDSILYEPEEKIADNIMPESSNDIVIAEAEPVAEDIKTTANAEADDDEIVLADASKAPSFYIPLVHHFNTENGKVTISNNADSSQIAMASHDVNIDNLGTDTAEAVIEPLEETKAKVETEENNINEGSVELSANSAFPKIEDDPWEIAETSNKHASRNSLKTYSSENRTQIAALDKAAEEEITTEYKMQKNILIPIPEEIMNEGNLTPQLSSSKENMVLEDEIRAKHNMPSLAESAESSANENKVEAPVNGKIEIDDEKDFDSDEKTSKNLTESITEWFSGNKKKSAKDNITAEDKQENLKTQKNSGNSIFNRLLGIGNGSEDNIVPTELKLAFQPNRAEISGQTLEWLHAFADNAVKNESVVVEIRIAKNAPYELQQKRLKLLYRILANNGVNYDKINIIFADREPNSFIIRNVRYASEEEKDKAIKRADNPWY